MRDMKFIRCNDVIDDDLIESSIDDCDIDITAFSTR